MHLTCKEAHTWGKHIGIPPRIGFGGLKIACTATTNFIDHFDKATWNYKKLKGQR